MSASPKYILRDLPAVVEVLALIGRINSHPNPNWSPEYDKLKPALEQLNLNLFGITWHDTFADDDLRGEARDTWNASFDILDLPKAEKAAALLELGWDVTDGNGQVWDYFRSIDRCLVCAVNGLAGRLPDAPISDDEAQARATGWAAGLEADAAMFRRNPRKGGPNGH